MTRASKSERGATSPTANYRRSNEACSEDANTQPPSILSTSSQQPSKGTDNAEDTHTNGNNSITPTNSTEHVVPKKPKVFVIDLDMYDYPDEESGADDKPSAVSFSEDSEEPPRKRRCGNSPQPTSPKRKRNAPSVIVIDGDETPQAPSDNKPSKDEDEAEPKVIECQECKNEIKRDDAFIGSDCRHPVCKPCIITFLEASVRDNKYPLSCLTCSVPYHVHACLSLLSENTDHTVLHNALERLVLERTMFEKMVLCSNEQCGTPFDWQPDKEAIAGSDIDDDDATPYGKSNPHIFCPLCGGETCARCNAPWHHGKTCKQFKHNPA